MQIGCCIKGHENGVEKLEHELFFLLQNLFWSALSFKGLEATNYHKIQMEYNNTITGYVLRALEGNNFFM